MVPSELRHSSHQLLVFIVYSEISKLSFTSQRKCHCLAQGFIFCQVAVWHLRNGQYRVWIPVSKSSSWIRHLGMETSKFWILKPSLKLHLPLRNPAFHLSIPRVEPKALSRSLSISVSRKSSCVNLNTEWQKWHNTF